MCTLYPFFDPLAQLIAASIAEVNIKYFYIIIYQTYTLRYNNSRREDHVIAWRLFTLTLLIEKWTENWLENSLSLEIKYIRLFICMEAGWC